MADKRRRPASTTARSGPAGQRPAGAAGSAQGRAAQNGGPKAGSPSLTAADRRARVAAVRAAAQRKERRERLVRWIVGGAGALVLLGALGVVIWLTSNHKSPTTASQDVATETLTGTQGPEGVVLEQGTPLAPISAKTNGSTIDGVQCNSDEQAAYHIHAHLSIYVNGTLRPVPAGIGTVQPQNTAGAGQPEFDKATSCYYWMHTHAEDGVIHVEAPTETTYTLGNFFAIWQQALSANQVGSEHGTVTAYLDGKPYTGDPSTIPLTSHADIQLDVGTQVAPKKIDWSISQL
jgi:hypothetical protein